MADAFMAGVEPGGLTNVQEIRILLCYMLVNLLCRICIIFYFSA